MLYFIVSVLLLLSPRSQAMVGGKPDPNPSVVMIDTTPASGRPRQGTERVRSDCTGVFISQNVILTAAHCIHFLADEEWNHRILDPNGKMIAEIPNLKPREANGPIWKCGRLNKLIGRDLPQNQSMISTHPFYAEVEKDFVLALNNKKDTKQGLDTYIWMRALFSDLALVRIHSPSNAFIKLSNNLSVKKGSSATFYGSGYEVPEICNYSGNETLCMAIQPDGRPLRIVGSDGKPTDDDSPFQIAGTVKSMTGVVSLMFNNFAPQLSSPGKPKINPSRAPLPLPVFGPTLDKEWGQSFNFDRPWDHFLAMEGDSGGPVVASDGLIGILTNGSEGSVIDKKFWRGMNRSGYLKGGGNPNFSPLVYFEGMSPNGREYVSTTRQWIEAAMRTTKCE